MTADQIFKLRDELEDQMTLATEGVISIRQAHVRMYEIAQTFARLDETESSLHAEARDFGRQALAIMMAAAAKSRAKISRAAGH